ncbi:ankyrin repeat-containing protein [Anaeramoeba ignava]|uniref:Ankyrin repeat-containing protein n=1 Tax=Anaeramoeba ignava TaxID=1746090 RepID=A0A9Q0REG2_ANAIG|nr:ankyrin repeat-containing protein [Anaeramoeba ignava]
MNDPKEIEEKNLNFIKKADSLSLENIEEVKEVLIEKDPLDQTQLLIACEKGAKELIGLLLEKGANPKAKTSEDKTPLHLICLHKNVLREVKLLIEKGADVNETAFSIDSPLHLACQYSSLDVISYLIEKGADLNAVTYEYGLWHSEKKSVFDFAFQNEDSVEVIKLLIEKGADINYEFSKNQSLLHKACEFELFDLVKFLVGKGMDIHQKDGNNQNPFQIACQKPNSFQIVKFFVEKGIDIHEATFGNQTALHSACISNSLDVVKLLIEKGANPNAQAYDGQTPFHYACLIKSIPILKVLLENGADIESRTENQETALHLVCIAEDSFEIIKLLVENGADLNAKTSTQDTPLHYILKDPQFSGMMPSFGYFGSTSFDQNEKNQDVIQIAKYLISKGADVDVKNSSLETPLSLANSRHLEKLIKFLLLNDINVYELQEQGISQEFFDLFSKIYSINQDFLNLLNSNDNFSDFQIQSNDSFRFKIHKLILLIRFDNNQSNLEKFVENCAQKPKEDVEFVLNFLYTGFCGFSQMINKLNQQKEKNNLIEKGSSFIGEKGKPIFENSQEKQENVKEFFREIGLDSKWFESKKGRKGILNDLGKLYQQNDSKDFTIIIEEKEIKVHKLILILRSELFKGMFQLNIEDKSNQVHDYSKKSFQTLNQIIYFLYHDKFDKDQELTKENLEELRDTKDYFQLNENSMIDLIFQKFQKKMN